MYLTDQCARNKFCETQSNWGTKHFKIVLHAQQKAHITQSRCVPACASVLTYVKWKALQTLCYDAVFCLPRVMFSINDLDHMIRDMIGLPIKLSDVNI